MSSPLTRGRGELGRGGVEWMGLIRLARLVSSPLRVETSRGPAPEPGPRAIAKRLRPSHRDRRRARREGALRVDAGSTRRSPAPSPTRPPPSGPPCPFGPRPGPPAFGPAAATALGGLRLGPVLSQGPGQGAPGGRMKAPRARPDPSPDSPAGPTRASYPTPRRKRESRRDRPTPPA